ncbi:MAG: hypothetical protein ACYSWO_20215 [Planctomycetota bacterium]|jgi:hypothetical protein
MSDEKKSKTESRRFVVALENSGKPRSRITTVETISRIASFLLVPVLVASFGWIIQGRLKYTEVSVEYVRIATDILRDQPTNSDSQANSDLEKTEALRAWAVNVLSEHSAVQLSGRLKERLLAGDDVLPKSTSARFPGLQDPTYSAYIYRGEEHDEGWQNANDAEALLGRLLIDLVADWSDYPNLEVDENTRGIVFDWGGEPASFLDEAQTQDFRTVLKRISDARK